MCGNFLWRLCVGIILMWACTEDNCIIAIAAMLVVSYNGGLVTRSCVNFFLESFAQSAYAGNLNKISNILHMQ